MQGCFLVHPSGTRKMIPHEISIDMQGDFPRYKDFLSIKSKLPKYSKRGINTIYLSGVCERPRNHFSPKSRVNISIKYGGLKGLSMLINEAHELDIKVIVDFSYRISSMCPDQRYLDQ